LSTRHRLSAEARRQVIEEAASEVFAERGYHGASIDEIARRSEVSAPVVYDHFESKQDLYKRLLERHQSELLELWREQLAGDDPPELRIRRALEAWFDYIAEHPAWLLVFRDAPPELADFHREIRARGLSSLASLTERESLAEPGPEVAIATELFRSAVAGVAIWWQEHGDVPRDQVVAVIMNLLWQGFERALAAQTSSS
jgi:AcrR family transcriptional regulator